MTKELYTYVHTTPIMAKPDAKAKPGSGGIVRKAQDWPKLVPPDAGAATIGRSRAASRSLAAQGKATAEGHQAPGPRRTGWTPHSSGRTA